MPEAVPAAPPAETAPTQVTTTTQTSTGPDSWETNPGAGGRDQVLADLAETRKQAKAAAKELEELRAWKAEQETASLGELEKAQKAAAEAVARAETAERQALVRQVALDKGLPKALAGRLQGKTQAELEADADELLKLVPAGPSGPRPDPTQGASQTPPVRGADLGLAEARKRFGDRVNTKQ